MGAGSALHGLEDLHGVGFERVVAGEPLVQEDDPFRLRLGDGTDLPGAFESGAEGEFDEDARSGTGLAVDLRGSSQRAGELDDAPDSPLVWVNGIHVEANSPILYLDADAAGILRNAQENRLALTVTAGVVQQFLDDHQERHPQFRGKFGPVQVFTELDLRTAAGLAVGHQAGDGGAQRGFIQLLRLLAVETMGPMIAVAGGIGSGRRPVGRRVLGNRRAAMA